MWQRKTAILTWLPPLKLKKWYTTFIRFHAVDQSIIVRIVNPQRFAKVIKWISWISYAQYKRSGEIGAPIKKCKFKKKVYEYKLWENMYWLHAGLSYVTFTCTLTLAGILKSRVNVKSLFVMLQYKRTIESYANLNSYSKRVTVLVNKLNTYKIITKYSVRFVVRKSG